jgi:solute:Na+ symporter, SSS family
VIDLQSPLGPWDWALLGGYFVLLAATGVWFSRRKQKDTADFFLAGRSMPVWAVAISVLATTQSGATFIGAPESSYLGNLTYLSTNIGMVIAALIVAFVFLPAFYRAGVTTPYGLLERRFGAPAKTASAVMFMAGRVLASGARLYLVAIPAALILFGDAQTQHVVVCIAVMAVVGVFYTLVGGIRSVIWTDVIQATLYLGAATVALIVLLNMIPIGLGEIVNVLGTAAPDGGSKLTVIDVGLDPAKPGLGFDPAASFTLLTVVIAFTMLGVASYGTDNDMVQRLLTCKDKKRSGRSMLAATLLGIPAVALFLALGLLLYVFYKRPDVMGAAAPDYVASDSRKVFLEFILHEMPPGMAGLMMAGLFAAGLSSLNSALNAMSASMVEDVYRPARPTRSERHYLVVGRLGVVCWGAVLGGFAVLCVYWQRISGLPLLDFALGVMMFAYSGLLAVFVTALFTRRGSSRSVIFALAVGFVVTFVLNVWNIMWANDDWAGLRAWIPATLDGLPRNIAWPWHLVIGSSCAFVVCAMGIAQERQQGSGIGQQEMP